MYLELSLESSAVLQNVQIVTLIRVEVRSQILIGRRQDGLYFVPFVSCLGLLFTQFFTRREQLLHSGNLNR
ncbi:MAG: hypothetical protein GXP15_04145 [Gammaproteobacteria bacterium]|nr:hypothetical protein [Gammaproteobacteria bacterium]